jgi:hypothetical protein
MISSDDEGTAPGGASGSRWEPTEGGATTDDPTATDQDAVPPAPADETAPARTRWRPSRSLSIAAAAAIAGLVIGGVGGWAAGSASHGDDQRMRPAMVGFQNGDDDGRMPGGPGGMPGGQLGGPGGPGVVPGQPQPSQGDDSDDDSTDSGSSTDGGQQS